MDMIALPQARPRRWFDFSAADALEIEPIRAELMSVERLEQHAEALARAQPVLAPAWHAGRSLLARTRQNARVLRRHFESVARATASQRSVTPAAEWFVDNYYVVERQLQLIRDDLPAGYYRQLPKLGSGPLGGLPRIAGIAWSFVAHTDSHFDPVLLERFVMAYQRVESLTLGELWALASVLRVVLIENLRRCADRIVSGRAQREAADVLADRLLGTPTRRAEPVDAVLGIYDTRALPRTLAVQLVQRLRDCDPNVTPALRRVEELLHAGGGADAAVHEELQRQSANNVTVRNIVTSLVQLSALDWSDIVEQLSVVDAVLAADSDFAGLDFATRNRYRSAIEEIARDCPASESDVARAAIAAAQGSAAEAAAREPGYFLIGAGRGALEAQLGYRAPLGLAARRAVRGAGVAGYLGVAGLLTLGALAGLSLPLRSLTQVSLVPLLCLLALPISDAVIALLNSLLTRLIRPAPLAALDLKGVVPAEYRALVAVPILLHSAADVEEALTNLESHYLSGPRGELYFALLADGVDAAAATVDGDAQLDAAGRRGIAELNARYGPAPGGARFLWLNRARRFNPAQGCWMGWERKRGKVHELNRLLRGARETNFLLTPQERGALPAQVRYVLVLDADTQLPHGAAEKLIAKLSHPLNRPQFDASAQRVRAGYGILQPRVTPSLPNGSGSTLVQEVFSGPPGLDPYAFAASDLYQDVFEEGSFTGKGLYDIDAFECALAGRIDENAVLSHDLLEGLYARAALASDVEVVEPVPDRYDVIIAREHRWARGDWQLLPWLACAARGPRAISALGRWKLIDNLRRTLVPPATWLALVAGWLLPLPYSAWWTALLVATVGVAPLLPVVFAVRDRPRDLRRASERQALRHDLRLACLRWAFALVFLADRAWWMGDAIVRTLTRLFFTRRHLLDWTTAAQSRRLSSLAILDYFARLRGGTALALVAALLVLLLAPANLPLALPWLVLWLAAPLLARFASHPQGAGAGPPLTTEDARELRLIARRTWVYFERFVTAEEHFLPPDNFQETPAPVLAQRTSPTNVGMYLLSAAAAFEFGWHGLFDFVGRIENTLAGLSELERFRGHFFNWYDTRTTQPLLPRYVSTVDSGNLAGALLALANSLAAAAERPLWSEARLAGVADALALVPEGARQSAPLVALAMATRMAVSGAPGLTALQEPASAVLAAAPQEPAGEPDWRALAAHCVLSHGRDLAALEPRAIDQRPECATLAQIAAAAEHPGAAAASELLARLARLATHARQLANAMDFAFLLKPHRMLLSIGYNVTESRLDSGDYDLLASEARLASFVAIAKRDVPARHWFRLDRRSVAYGRVTALLSWSGSMFEYLMPALVMRAPQGSLLDRAQCVAVRAQRDYGASRSVPWGVSESAYNTRDVDQTYQYSPFGVPALGLKRGLANDTVISPYATALAAMVDAPAAAANFRALQRCGALGHLGFYEALDFTPDRLAEGEEVAVVRAYMAHHQGMTVVALANALRGGVVQGYFLAEAAARATELLLQEKPPRSVEAAPGTVGSEAHEARLPVLAGRRRLHTWRPRTPHTQLLSNGRYAVMLNAGGSGFSRCGALAVTRWSQDATCDASGTALYLRDCDSGGLWSAGFQPTAVVPDSYRVTFTEDRAEIVRADGPWSTRLQVLVSPEHDAEARRLSLSNLGDRTREIEVTSYAEVVLAPAAADRAHRAFSNLFVQTSYEPLLEALVAERRARAAGEAPVCAVHLGVIEAQAVGEWEYESDRDRFIGRDQRLARPRALGERRRLSGASGIVLDPVFALRRRLRVAPGETARITFWTAVAATREQALSVADRVREPAAFDRASTLAWTRARVQLHHLGLDPDEASLFQRLAAHVFYLNPALRAGADTLRRNRAGVHALWAHGISGDRPIVQVEIDDAAHLPLVRQLLRAHEYLTLKSVALDLVVINSSVSSYVQDLQAAIEALVRGSQQRLQSGAQPGMGSVYPLRAETMSPESRLALLAAARVVLVSRRGTLAEQLERLEDPAAETAPPAARRAVRSVPATAVSLPQLELPNGTGGFAADGTEYVVVLKPGLTTPMPWINVIAQPNFGFQVSATGAGFTWAQNSRENPLTPWSNDAVSDPAGEALYVRDDDSGELFTPTAAPIRDPEGTYIAVHGRGYSRFRYTRAGIACELLQFVPRGRALKVSRLRLRNEGTRPRRLSVCAYAEWSLGGAREAMAQYIVTERCAHTGALTARNPWNRAFAAHTAFLDLAGEQSEVTCDRREFLGLDGSSEAPEVLRGAAPLSGRTGAGLDPCAALLTSFELAPGATRDVVCFAGQAEEGSSVATEVQAARNLQVDAALAELNRSWNELLGQVQVSTPDRAFDLLLNGWLPYQVLSCRLWARAAFYQASGAYGFRDQLQDCMALTGLAPALAREHLLRAAARQFFEGDVQHWWMPEDGRGVRTHISDDRVWLAYCTAHYVTATADGAVLDEVLPYLSGEPLPPNVADRYFAPQPAPQRGSLYEHCARALDASLAVGAHGLPLIGGGDWNDGLNLVGAQGRGESVWLGWFLLSTLKAFVPLALQRDDAARGRRWMEYAQALQGALETHGWDGDWYRRGYFDDGSPLGSAANRECQIDSIAQSWAVLSGAANPARAAHAMAAVWERLLRPEEGELLLFTPPFVSSEPDPGYIRAYPPGIRENGGQYTHGSIWSLMAFARLGEGERAKQLFDCFSPIRHARGAADVTRYKLEPYAVAGDIYAAPAPAGRGGWSWYTGAAGWLYRAGLESILGIRREGTQLLIEPCIPRAWRRYDVQLRHGKTLYQITVTNPFGAASGISHAEVDHLTILRPPLRIPLSDDEAVHTIRVVMG